MSEVPENERLTVRELSEMLLFQPENDITVFEFAQLFAGMPLHVSSCHAMFKEHPKLRRHFVKDDNA